MQDGQPRITTSCVEPPTTEYVQLYTPTPSLLYSTTQVHMIISPLSPFSLITLTYQLQQMFINGLIFFKVVDNYCTEEIRKVIPLKNIKV